MAGENIGEKIIGFLKKNLLGSFSGLFDNLTGMFDGASEIFGDKFDGIKDFFAKLFNGFKEKATPDAMLANATITAVLDKDKVFDPLAANLKLDGTVSQDLQKLTSETLKNFFSEGIPALDKKKQPYDAADTILKLHNHIVDYLAGTDKQSAAIQNPDKNARLAQAYAAANQITGLDLDPTKEYDVNSILPTITSGTGLAKALANLQIKAGAEGYKPEDMTATDAAFTIGAFKLPNSPANIPNLPGNNSIVDGSNVNNHGPAPKTPPKPPQTHPQTKAVWSVK